MTRDLLCGVAILVSFVAPAIASDVDELLVSQGITGVCRWPFGIVNSGTGDVLVLWQRSDADFTPGPLYAALMKRQPDGSYTVSPPVQYSNDRPGLIHFAGKGAFNSDKNTFVVCWAASNRVNGTDFIDIYTRRISSTGTLLGPSVQVTTGTEGDSDPALVYIPAHVVDAPAKGGRFLLVWFKFGNPYGYYSTLLNDKGAKPGEAALVMQTGDQGYVHGIEGGDGRYLVSVTLFIDKGGIRTEVPWNIIIDSSGKLVNQNSPADEGADVSSYIRLSPRLALAVWSHPFHSPKVDTGMRLIKYRKGKPVKGVFHPFEEGTAWRSVALNLGNGIGSIIIGSVGGNRLLARTISPRGELTEDIWELKNPVFFAEVFVAVAIPGKNTVMVLREHYLNNDTRELRALWFDAYF